MASPDRIDEGTVALYLKVPGEKVVLLQALTESYEGLAMVRTLNIRKSLVAILTTPSMLEDCQALLDSLKTVIQWEYIDRPKEAEDQLYLGYFKKREKHSC